MRGAPPEAKNVTNWDNERPGRIFERPHREAVGGRRALDAHHSRVVRGVCEQCERNVNRTFA